MKNKKIKHLKEIKLKTSILSDGKTKKILTIKTIGHPNLSPSKTCGLYDILLHQHTCPIVEGVNHIDCKNPCVKKTKRTVIDDDEIETRVLVKCYHCPETKLIIYKYYGDNVNNYTSTTITNDGWGEYTHIDGCVEPVYYRDSTGVKTELGSITLPNPEDIKHLFNK